MYTAVLVASGASDGGGIFVRAGRAGTERGWVVSKGGSGRVVSDHAFRLLEEPGSWELARWRPEATGLATAVFCTTLVCPGVPRTALSSREIWMLASRCTLPV